MASLFLAIPDLELKVQPHVTFAGFKAEGSLLPIESLDFRIMRPIGMQIGNLPNQDAAHLRFTPLKVVRQRDEASENILSYLLMPGKKGFECCFYKCRLLTMNSGEKAICPFFNVDIFGCRIINLNYDLRGDSFVETFYLAYTRMSMWGCNYDEMVEGMPTGIKKTWAYDLSSGKAQSRRKGK
ncbi:hypothetical protein [Spongorhabdus nitratireducens]